MTRVNEMPAAPESTSFITVKTQPKKKAVQARQRQLEAPSLGVAAEQQRRMLGQVRGYEYNEDCYEPQHYKARRCRSSVPKYDLLLQHEPYLPPCEHPTLTTEPDVSRTRARRARAGGDRIMCGRSVQIDGPNSAAPGPNDQADISDYERFDQCDLYDLGSQKKTSADVKPLSQKYFGRRRHVPREVPAKTVTERKWRGRTQERDGWNMSPESRRMPTHNNFSTQLARDEPGERPVVELFSNNIKNAASNVSTLRPSPHQRKLKKDTQPEKKKEARHPHKLKYRCRRYELPTMASQMKQADARYNQDSGAYPNIPFVVSKSTAPSHNIGVNIQQVLNGLKVQQPLTGIPPTIAHHMGLGSMSTFMINKNVVPAMSERREINTIKLGRRLVRLPSSKYMSYNRALNLYREGDGMVPRFLRAINRPHYFYTSMYNLTTNREDQDGATSKGNNAAAQEAKQSLAEYASLYREYQQVDKALREGKCEPEWERRREDIWKELALREERVRKMVQDYKGSDAELASLRASASTTEDGCRRRSCYKLNDQ